MKQIPKTGFLLICVTSLLCSGCGFSGSNPGNMPYEPDTPAPAAHDGLFVSEHGSMRFNGDGTAVETDFDAVLSGLTGLPEGAQTGTYVFLSGDLPPHGSMPVRYDTAHELRIDIGENSAVIAMGIAAADGKSAQSGVNTVTPDCIPMLFHAEGKSFDVIFTRESSTSDVQGNSEAQ